MTQVSHVAAGFGSGDTFPVTAKIFHAAPNDLPPITDCDIIVMKKPLRPAPFGRTACGAPCRAERPFAAILTGGSGLARIA